jgi:hypothetical protein
VVYPARNPASASRSALVNTGSATATAVDGDDVVVVDIGHLPDPAETREAGPAHGPSDDDSTPPSISPDDHAMSPMLVWLSHRIESGAVDLHGPSGVIEHRTPSSGFAWTGPGYGLSRAPQVAGIADWP